MVMMRVMVLFLNEINNITTNKSDNYFCNKQFENLKTPLCAVARRIIASSDVARKTAIRVPSVIIPLE